MADESWNHLKLRHRVELLARFHWRTPGVALGALLRCMSPFDFMLEREHIRWIQMGGESISDQKLERFWNEMPTSDFITVMMSGPSESEEDGDAAECFGSPAPETITQDSI